ncbi:uncharacterized protein DDB_G0275275-like [Danaus plexippus]|uniref:uncharacterized protein DDB_G0275275-like n=1 Tax=Danaus plexippus TaxID=13037 RepID=UPI002AB2BD6D|nr:uncharacterized protein DDB_G0275275-like [Danaus plexippus]
MFKKTFFVLTVVLLIFVNDVIEARKLSGSRSSSSGRSSSKRTNPKPIPTSFSYPQSSAPKPSLFGWQEKPAQKTQVSSQKSKPSNQGHSYPSSNTGLSGNGQPKQPPTQEGSMQRSNVPSQHSSPNKQNANEASHTYPASNSLSGNSGTNSGTGYPQGTGLSGSNYPAQPSSNINTANGYPVNNVGPYRNTQNAPPPYSSAGNTNYHPQGPPPPYTNVGNSNYHHAQHPPPPYTNYGHNYGGSGGSYSPQAPGYFGNYVNPGKNYGGVSRSGNVLTGVGIAGAGIGTVLTGLALWNLARSTGHHHHTVIYDNRGQPIAVAPDNSTTPVVDPILSDLVNCTLTINNGNTTEVLAIPCSIATSFTPDANVKDESLNKESSDNTECIITVVTKSSKEFMTSIPCSVLLNTAAENNVTEAPILDTNTTIENGTSVLSPQETLSADQPTALRLSSLEDENFKEPKTTLNCTQEQGEIRDPINPCFSVKHNLTVIPLETTVTQ